MNLTHDDLMRRGRAKPTDPVEDKAKMHAEIEQHTAAYLAAGGTITPGACNMIRVEQVHYNDPSKSHYRYVTRVAERIFLRGSHTRTKP